MNIQIKTIPHKDQAYPTCGDWRFNENEDLNIFVSDMKNWKYEALVAVHELIEVILCKDRGITTEEVDEFDKMFEKEREDGKWLDGEEPGNDPRAPYKREHEFATLIEQQLAAKLNVDWPHYDKTVNNL